MGSALKVPMMLQALVVDRPASPTPTPTPKGNVSPAPAPTSGKTVTAAPAPATSTATKFADRFVATSTTATVAPAPATVATSKGNPAPATTLSAAPAPTPPPTMAGLAPNSAGLEPGVHLSWALPDALLRARVQGEEGRGEAMFPELPDSWLVVRFNPLPTSGKRTYSAWVVDSWKGTVQPLATWNTKVSSAVANIRLTAAGFMDATGAIVPPPYPSTRPAGEAEAFTAYYPVARDRFGFFDALTGVGAGPVSYLVCGWYSQPARDPLMAAATSTARIEWLDRLELEPEGVMLVDLDVATLVAKGIKLPPGATLPPDHLVAHGMVVDVPVNGGGGSMRPTSSPVPDPNRVEFTLGDSPSDALASLLSELDERRWLLRMLETKGVRAFQNIEALGRIQAELHAQGFISETNLTLDEAKKVLAGNPAWAGAVAALTSQTSSFDFYYVEGKDEPVIPKYVDPGKGKGLPSMPKVPESFPDWYLNRNKRQRYPVANPPVLMLSNAGRSYRYGHDGRMHPDGKLSCRMTGQFVKTMQISTTTPKGKADRTFAAADLLQVGTELAPLDLAVQELVTEVGLLDPTLAPLARALLATPQIAADAASVAQLEQAWKLETTFWWLTAFQDVESAEVAALSKLTGVLPSPMSVAPWSDPWGTFYVDYDALFVPTEGAIQQSWTLDAVENLAKSPRFAATAVRVQGRAMAMDTAQDTLASGLKRLTSDVELRATLGEEAAVALEAQAASIEALDVVSGDVLALDKALNDSGLMVRAGIFSLTSLKLVDTFGRTVSLNPTALRVPADALLSAQAAPGQGQAITSIRGVAMPPRLLRPTRLDLRFLQSTTDAKEATSTAGPVCGYLVPDYLDQALEVFDATGKSLGQLRGNGSGFEWEPAPGIEAHSASRMVASIANPHLKRVVQGLLDAGLADLARQRNSGAGPSPLAAVLALFDAVRGTVDRKGDTEEFMALLMGAPIAVVRAKIGLESAPTAEEMVREAVPQAAPPPPRSLPFPGTVGVRLGVLEQLDDGLLGYMLDDVPGIQTSLAASIHLSSPGLGVDADLSALPGIQSNALITLEPTQTRMLTLLMVPGAGVHATAGLLPQKRVTLTRDWLKVGLEKLAPTFSFGPLLVDPAQLRLPVPGAERFEWQWVNRTRQASGTDGWSSLEVKDQGGQAILPASPVLVQDGWLKVVRD